MDGVQVEEARAATRAELARTHTAAWIDRVERGELERRESLALGLPWSPQLVQRARSSTGATVQAAEAALADGVAMNLGGGTHHAFADSGRGFCVFNDVVTALRAVRTPCGDPTQTGSNPLPAPRNARVVPTQAPLRALVLDLDVHQGDGTHSLLADDPDAYTVSVNGGANYPFRRVPGDLEVDLPDGTGDDRYLEELERLLPRALGAARPDLAFVLAGADPYEGDRLGRLALTKAGLAARDRLVRDALRAAGVPACVTLAGGYAERIEDTVEINLATVKLFAE
jgi:acetoin utilization deacetylase AcuC-like enzyme